MSTFRRLVVASSVVAAAAALAACDSEMVGAAAVVDGDRLTVSELQDRAREVEALEGFDLTAAGGAAALQQELLTRHIQHQIFLRLAEREDIEVSQAAIDDQIDEYRARAPEGNLAPLLAQNGYTDESFRDGVFDQLIAQTYAEENDADQAALTEALNEVADDLGVEVNPRYGTWGDDVAVAPDSGSISKALDATPDQ